ncbi:MAG TPA: hypothetical protein VFC93_04945, partial [Chloroflexota bacterium]|nr:hypothetical protein [Chloroflexota bacterium]
MGRRPGAGPRRAGAPELAASSPKAALDADGDDPAARTAALGRVPEVVAAVAAYAAGQPAAAAAVRGQDVVVDAAGTPALGRGVARDRR